MNMKRNQLPPRGIAILDANDDLRRELSKKFSRQLPQPIVIMDFAVPEEAERAFQFGRIRRRMEPAVLVTDMIGTTPIGTSFVDEVRKSFPLTKIILYSHRTKPAEAVTLAFSHRVIDDYQVKTQHKILDSVIELYEKYTHETSLSRLRAYIARCPDPETPFFPDGFGKYLNIIDAYWEIVRQTELGRDLLLAWDGIVDDWYQPTPSQAQGAHVEARKRSLCHLA